MGELGLHTWCDSSGVRIHCGSQVHKSLDIKMNQAEFAHCQVGSQHKCVNERSFKKRSMWDETLKLSNVGSYLMVCRFHCDLDSLHLTGFSLSTCCEMYNLRLMMLCK